MNKQGDYGNIPSMGNFEKRIQFVVKNLETGAFFSSVFFLNNVIISWEFQ